MRMAKVVGAAGARLAPLGRGNGRDSDETPSLCGFKRYNWCVTLDEARP